MERFILNVGYLIIAYSLIILVVPKLLCRTIDFFSVGSRLYLVGLFQSVLGLTLLIVAPHSKLWGYVVIIGLILAGSGLSLFFFALKRTKKLLRRLQDQTHLILRLYIIIALAIWALLIYSLLP